MCVCVYLCIQVYIHMYAHACEAQRSSLGVFLSHTVPYFLRLGLSLKLEFSNLAHLAGQQDLEIPVSSHLSDGIT